MRPASGPDHTLGELVIFRLCAALDAPIERILLRTCPDGEQLFVEMQPEETHAARAGQSAAGDEEGLRGVVGGAADLEFGNLKRRAD